MFEPQITLVVGLLVMIPLVALGRRVGIAYPIVLVVTGFVLGFIPGLPAVALDPNLVLVLFLPPLLYWEAITAPTDIMLANWTQIGMLAVGLVLATTIAVAVTVHAVIPNLPWAAAFVLGAIVAPTDELAAAPVLERFRMPRHLIAIVEGESLANDALSLVLYSAALSAVATGAFDLGRVTLSIVGGSIAAFVLGLLIARLAIEGWRHVKEAQLQGVISVLLPFLAYVPAQRFGISGVLSVVTAGVYANRFTPNVITAETRLRGIGFWESFVFLANAILFLLVGLQFHGIMQSVLQEYSWQAVLLYAAIVNAVVIGVRFAWILGLEYVPLLGGASEHPEPNWKHAFITAWSGLRGAVSLAAALAIPITLANGEHFPRRELVIFLTYTVIIVTLLGGGLTLPAVLKWLNASEGEAEEADELKLAFRTIADAALRRIDALESDKQIEDNFARLLRRRYENLRDVTQRRDPEVLEREERRATAEREVVEAQREALAELREKGEIDNAVQRQVLRHLDLAEQRTFHHRE